LPQVLERIKNPHYLYRMTVLVAISALASIVSPDVLCNAMLPAVIGCSKDKVRPARCRPPSPFPSPGK
jgi:serine/threonine-protein phosphatase 2A regulatory subunit A